MEVAEINSLIDTFKANAGSGLLLLFYYLLLYGRRLIEGLGLNQSKGHRAVDIKTRLEVEKLKIELAQQKRESGLDDALLKQIEAETLAQLGPKSTHQFNNKQKFVAIPFMLLMGLVTFSEINDIQTAGGSSEDIFDTVFGYVFICIVVVIGFWGIEHLQKRPPSKARTAGFVAYWTFAIFIIAAFIASAIEMAIGVILISDDYVGIYFLIGLVSSLILGALKKLPGMKVVEISPESKKQSTGASHA
ncbi:hypothetical protein K0504_01295 [Neiella marina]|uniref:Uncharacterized protein n=1 Tax=Neiella holothuriorum TaxID=2870530 RepID=A0ABS7ECV4_9GAMM|nr:hypothetical protein [Neiella holothuriorum]MBW8189656.1 hypothetical protein [Neiella holothuriorum]